MHQAPRGLHHQGHDGGPGGRGIGLATVNAALKAGYSVRALSRFASTIRLHNPSPHLILRGTRLFSAATRF